MLRFNKEGHAIIFVSIIITAILIGVAIAVFSTLGVWRWLSYPVIAGLLILQFYIAFFFRDPRREHIVDESTVFSSADGTVVVIEEVEEREFLKEKTIQISVFMSISNVHKNWYPVSGRIVYRKYHPGRYIVAWNPKSSELNEHVSVAIDTGGCRILFRQIAGYVARRIVSYAKEGDEVTQNTKCGFIKFGSRVDIFVPADSEILVSIGQKVKGSLTPLARLGRDNFRQGF